MPRQPRRLPPGCLVHVIQRGNRRQDIFEDEADYRRFFDSMQEAAEDARLERFCLTLMPNHFHDGLIGDQDVISATMHRVLTSHAVYMNKKYGRTGHLFEDRFTGIPLDPVLGLKPLVRYVHRNPIRSRLVDDLKDWKWSTHHAYLDPASSGPSGRDRLLEQFRLDGDDVVEAYRSFVEDGLELPKAGPKEPFPLSAIAAVIEREAGHSPGYLRSAGRNQHLGRLRRDFVKAALQAGHLAVSIARFLGVSEAAVHRYRHAC